jgi:UDP-N-acetylglucosamine enolpyruvyl transferase
MLVKKKPFHGFGWILETIVGVAQVAAQGSATAVQQDRVRREQRKSSSLLSLLHQQRLKEIEAEGKTREEILRLKAEESLTTEKGIRTAAYLGVTTALVASLVLLYFLLRGNTNEKK